MRVFRWIGRIFCAVWTGFWATVSAFRSFAPGSGALAIGLLIFALTAFVASAIGTFLPSLARWSFLIVEVLGQLPGPAAFFVCAALLMGPLSFLTFWVDSYHVPFPQRPPVIIVLIIGMAFTSWQVSLHNVRVIEPPDVPVWPSHRATLEREWDAWRTACAGGRQDVAPIIVAVSGGASRAGLWGLRVLTEVDRDIGSRHAAIFAISSVSGGSLGAAAYVSALAAQGGAGCTLDRLDGDRAQRERREAFFRDAMARDALGPVLAGLLWGDAARALLGLPAAGARWIGARLGVFSLRNAGKHLPVDSQMRGGDRAAALEEGFERNWRKAYKAHRPFDHNVFRFAAPYLLLAYNKHGVPLGRVPLWIANGADDQTGDRILTAPFLFDKDAISTFAAAEDALGLLGTDVPISTAIHDTARFPYISPAGELAAVGTSTTRGFAQIIDGGYFENEGLETALELAGWLKGKGADPIVVQVTADAGVQVDASGKARDGENQIPRCSGSVNGAVQAAGESRPLQLLAPIIGVNAARSGHTHVVLREALRKFCRPGDQRFFHFYLYAPAKGDIPLNWVLSPSAARTIWKDELNWGGNGQELKNLQAVLGAPD